MNFGAPKAFGGILVAWSILLRRDSWVFIVDNLSEIKIKVPYLGIII